MRGRERGERGREGEEGREEETEGERDCVEKSDGISLTLLGM